MSSIWSRRSDRDVSTSYSEAIDGISNIVDSLQNTIGINILVATPGHSKGILGFSLAGATGGATATGAGAKGRGEAGMGKGSAVRGSWAGTAPVSVNGYRSVIEVTGVNNNNKGEEDKGALFPSSLLEGLDLGMSGVSFKQ